ncbi:889dde9b-bf05-41fa-a7ed-e2614602617d [Sclerotinia trifoliorum]|uniref:889dde9b-bf05-41fa-a7ed-e2614602617d n=1 Tax=Sclerotinia trifoliorum TaxID=28548 RepID=A0A8H2ZRN6_9HELO|nr:889dde9b-bf05-41fa-a7ed-e2614602617d [Sclerotinia trifoliorum]
MPKDAQHVQFLNDYYNTLVDPNILTKPTQEIADDCNNAHFPPTTQGVDGVDSQIVGRHMSECRKRAANQSRAKRNTPEQTQILEAAYALDHYPPPGTKMILMWQTGLSYRKVKNWFEHKAKVLKMAGKERKHPDSRSSRHATRMWKAYDEDREGYVKKLLNGSICPVTGADLTRRMGKNAPVNDAMKTVSGHLGLGVMAPGPNVGFGSNYQNGQGNFRAMQTLPHNLMNQHGQAGSQNVPAPPHYQMISHGQNGFQRMQAPLPDQMNQQAQQGPHPMPVYTQGQSQMYSMLPAQFMNIGNNDLTAGQSYAANGNEQAGQQIAQPGANFLNPNMRHPHPALLNGINTAVSYRHNGGMSGWSSIPSGQPMTQNYQTSRGQWQEQYASPYPQVPVSHAEQPPNKSLTQTATSSGKRKPAPVEIEIDSDKHSSKRPCRASKPQAIASHGKREFTPADGAMDETERPKKQHKSMRQVSRTKGQMKPKPSPEFLAQLTSIAEGGYQGQTFTAAPNTGMSFNNGTITDFSMLQTPAISKPTTATPEIDSRLLDPLLFSDNERKSGEAHATANQDRNNFVPQQQFTHEAQKEANPTVQGRVQSPTAHNASSKGRTWEAELTAQYPPTPKNSSYEQNGVQELELQDQAPSQLEYPVSVQDVENSDNLLLSVEDSSFLDSIPMDGEFDFKSSLRT